jgi:hypothetical protein
MFGKRVKEVNKHRKMDHGMRNSKEKKLKRFPQGNLAHGQSLRSKGDDYKFLNGRKAIILTR